MHDLRSQLSSLIATLVALCGAALGTFQVDYLGRRRILILGTFLCALSLIGAMICSALSGVRSSRVGSIALADLGEATNKDASRGAIAFLILLGAAFAWGYQPLLPVYPA